ncbi:hypothetical protein N5U55_08320 [Aliarcobacter butzleri]|uniref:hypothetical protein n=1 Tax=Aliarcobacter butzleri TaxID=28197 RepID=UPI0021B29C6C|nr:hypothetical protein [Aliarcobacter butzleri]MCT7584110.1 hypothetical protein [Aliarcobacter butzleri]
MKKAYTLLITIVLISTFSYLGVLILETKALKNQNLSNQYLYIQAKNHLNFFEDFVKNYDLKDITHLQIEDELFDIYATKLDSNVIDIFVKAKDFDISIHKQIIKE